jgi:hypothetical protein
VPAMSRPRASLLSSAILCSFNSEIVMFYLGFEFIGGMFGASGGICLTRGSCGRPELSENLE